METKKYVGITGGPGGFDGYAGLTIGTIYAGAPQEDDTVKIALPTGRTATVTAQQWTDWFSYSLT